MSDHYSIDLQTMKLDYLQALCEKGDVLPSEQILTEDIQERFDILRSMGVDSLADLSAALKTKKKLENFSVVSGLPLEYLKILRRRVGFYTAKPVHLKKIIWIDPEAVQHLVEQGIKNTHQLLAQAHTPQEREKLSRSAGVSSETLLELVKIADLLRAPFVGPVYARLFYEVGADTMEKIAAFEADDLCARMRSVNADQKLTKAALPGEADMETFLDLVRLLPNPIQYS
jgi:hypothetical protein